ncbi:hypothetical protein C823_002554 [Eubacterium plexicaudatum ASF492]|uniref:DUF2225 domain-containing protein n=1 Tax=Eubacterium plexicaudatum ASF492 TaxID=1235802 RepID=N2A9A1_9FIRM|nr:hypothetical protein C823_002554 [Eubacterium plexicaudatum ASF492]
MSVLYDVEEEKKYVFTKKISCTNCGANFNDLRIMNSKLRRKEPDMDLRPRFQFVDSLKYGVTACPYCGFAAPVKSFEQLTSLHQKRIREKITSQFMQREPFAGETLDYATAQGQYELALVCAMVMELPLSEQAHLCLQLSWLIRGRLEEADAEQGLLDETTYKQLQEKQERYYRQAYDLFSKAFTQEDFPICGMDQHTFDYLLAVLSYHFKEYDVAVKFCGSIVQAKGISAKLKDKALMLKDEIMAAKKAEEEGQE